MKRGKRPLTDEMDKIRKLGEKETYKYLGILEPDTIKQEEVIEKIKNISREPKNYSRQKYITEPYQRNKYMNRDHFWSGQKKNLNKSTREQEN